MQYSLKNYLAPTIKIFAHFKTGLSINSTQGAAQNKTRHAKRLDRSQDRIRRRI